jgi:hypothetical protein
MTKLQLWQTDMAGFFKDPRMKDILLYLKTEVPSAGQESGDWYRGRHSTIAMLESLGVPPEIPKPTVPQGTPRQLYQSAPTTDANRP